MDNNSLRSDSGSPFSPADTENISEGIGLQLNIPIYSGGQTSSESGKQLPNIEQQKKN